MDGLLSVAVWVLIGAPVIGLLPATRIVGLWLAGASLVSSLILLFDVVHAERPIEWTLATWLSLPMLTVSFGVRCDGLSLLQVALTSAVLLIVLARWPENVSRRWLMLAWCGVTAAATASNLGQMFVGWSLSAWASSELARRETDHAKNSPAFRPVWLVQRVSDALLLTGIGLVWLHFHSLEYSAWTAEALARQRPELLSSIALCVLAGVIGRCAQLPLSVWLEAEAGFAAKTNRSVVKLSDEMVGLWNVPDGHQVAERLNADPASRWHAAEGDSIPAPVLAWWLCAAFLPVGICVLARFEPLLAVASNTRLLAVVVGAFTLTLCSASAAAQTNWLRVLSQLAVGQCGLVLLALSLDDRVGVSSGLFLLLWQSLFFVVLLASCSPNSRGLGDPQKSSYTPSHKGSDNRPWMAITALLLASGGWGRHALANVIWQAAFPLEVAATTAGNEDNVVLGATSSHMLPMVFVLLCLSEFLLGFALFRAYFLSRRDAVEQPHDVGFGRASIGWVVLIVSLLAGIGLGRTGGTWPSLLATSLRVPGVGEGGGELPSMIAVSDLWPLSAAGIVLAWWMYSKPSSLPEKLAAALGPFARLSRNRFYWDDLYFLAIVQPAAAISRWLAWFDERVWERSRQAARRGVARFAGEAMEPLAEGTWPVHALTIFSSVAVLTWMLLWLRS